MAICTDCRAASTCQRHGIRENWLSVLSVFRAIRKYKTDDQKPKNQKTADTQCEYDTDAGETDTSDVQAAGSLDKRRRIFECVCSGLNHEDTLGYEPVKETRKYHKSDRISVKKGEEICRALNTSGSRQSQRLSF